MTYQEFIEEWRDKSASIKCHTSGSTGIPQLVNLPKSEVYKSALRTVDFFRLSEGSPFHSCISPDYIGGKMMAVRAEICKGILTYEVPSNRPLSNYKEEEIDLLAVVPSQMIHILDHLEEMPQINNIIIGGSAIPPRLRERIANSGLNAWETYGMTETCSHVALRRIKRDKTGFIPLSGISVSQNAEGCLSISIEGWKTVETRDLVEISPDGTFEILGRYDSMIITGGKKVNPFELESKLEAEFGVEFLITSEPDEKWGEKIVCLFEDNELSVRETEIIAFCREHLSCECVPKEIIRTPLPRTSNGKKARRKKKSTKF